MPYDARLRSLTYSAPITLELTVRKDDQIDSETVEIGRIPIMVRSKFCNIHGLSKERLIENYQDPMDPGGYFIIKGNERIMVMAEDLAENQSFVETNKKGELTLKMFSSKGTYRIPAVLTQDKTGIFEIAFSRFKNLPSIVVIKALGLINESEIAKYIGKETDSLIVNLNEFVNLATS